MRKNALLIFSLAAFAALLIYPQAASASAYDAIILCGRLIIPSLFPFFVVSNMLSGSGAVLSISRKAEKFCSKLFGVSGVAASAFLIGISAGYPLGASYVAQEHKKGHLTDKEAGELAVFCNNSGPSFIMGAVGVGVFHSTIAGVFLYCVHILAAILGGIAFRGEAKSDTFSDNEVKIPSFSKAFTDAVKSSVNAVIAVSGFIIAFSVLIGILTESGVYMDVCAMLSRVFGTDLGISRAFVSGILELGNGIAALTGAECTPKALALAAFLLGWGSLSVHFQSFAMLDGVKFKAARYILGRLVIAVFGAVLAYLGALILF